MQLFRFVIVKCSWPILATKQHQTETIASSAGKNLNNVKLLSCISLPLHRAETKFNAGTSVFFAKLEKTNQHERTTLCFGS